MPQDLLIPHAGAMLLSAAVFMSAVLGLVGWWTTQAEAALKSPASGARAWLRSTSCALLSAHPRQRMHCLHFLVGVAACMTGLSALQFGVGLGIVEPSQANWLTGTALLYCIGTYGLLRSAWGRQVSDRALLNWHLHVCLVFMAWGYVIGGEGRPVALLLLLLMLSFNAFLADAALMRRLGLTTIVLFGLAMARVAINEEGSQLGPALQLVYFVVLVVMLLCLTIMIQQLDNLRRKSRARKQELQLALSRIGEMATRDELTGLFNRRHMLEWLHTEKQRCQRQGRSFCLGLIDLDHFKNINDCHGHAVGDEALTHAAHALAKGLRETDLIARWGGEEFLVVFTDTDCATAQVVVDRIRQDMSRSMVSASVPDLSLSFSAGLTTFKPEELLTRAMDRADRALYLAKAGGRARTLVVEDVKAAPRSPGRTPLSRRAAS
jgi:diguanylate cyclase (GGDEF)-like protein